MTEGSNGFGKFILLLLTWAAGSTILYFASLLSVSAMFIGIMLGICGICLLVAIVLFFTNRLTGAFIVAGGPLWVFGGIMGISSVVSTISRYF